MAPDVRDRLVAFFESHQKLVEADALELLLRQPRPLIASREVLERMGVGEPFVTSELVRSTLTLLRPSRIGAELSLEVRPPTPPSSAGDASPAEPFRLIRQGFVAPTPNTPPLDGYRRLFANRFERLREMLKGRPTLENLRSAHEIERSGEAASLIAMVRSVRSTARQHHLILTLEDETGCIEAFLPKEAPGAAEPILPDEVIGVRLEFGRDPSRLPRITTLERPDVPWRRKVQRSDTSNRALFLSDLHVGSKAFLADAWGRLVDFLKGAGPHPDLARTIRYVVVAGDLVDGIGIYPHQERDLAIPDVVEQYAELGRRLSELPSSVTIVVVPGNHDAVCPAEPQPALSPPLCERLGPNVRPLANPSTFSLEGVVVEAYHGRSLDDLIPSIPGASYSRPTEVMARMLRMRHLAPSYGGRTPLAPTPVDGLVVDPLPDILAMGHAHTFGVERYRGVLLLNVSTWQAETEYQRMRNITPVPARAVLVDLSTLGVTSIDCTSSEAVVAATSL